MRIVKKTKTKIILAAAAVFTAIAVLLTFRFSLAYLTDYERADNVITIGNVNLELSEGEFTDDPSVPVVAAGGTPPKAPTISNTGVNDEYVFIRIGVPVRNVTLLYEENTRVEVNGTETSFKKGTPTVHNYDAQSSVIQRSDEIYRTIADGASQASKTQISLLQADYQSPNTSYPNEKPQLDIEYNKGDGSGSNNENKKEGWVYLGRELNKTVNVSENATPDNRVYDFYYFGYNRRLKAEPNESRKVYRYKATVNATEKGLPVVKTYYMTETEYAAAFPSDNNVTASFPAEIPDELKGSGNKSKWTKEEKCDRTLPLFDRIQLKSFIDEELTSSVTNNEVTTKTDKEDYFYVNAYGIQADSLGDNTLDALARDAILTDDQVKQIFDIVMRKAGGT